MCEQSAVDALDQGQYSLDEICKYEAVYGRNFISPGGESTARALLGLVGFIPNMDVLDVGCGLGGAAFLMAQTYGAHVHGIDLSLNMLQIARSRCQESQLTQLVTFEHADILGYARPAAFDLAHSRDVFLHIHDKASLFEVIRRCLRPNGQLLFSDYLCRAGPKSDDFTAYIRKRGYDLRTLEEYRALLERAGFEVLLTQDRTGDFIEILERELEQIESLQLPALERAALAQSWRDKHRRASAGEQRWGVCMARAPDVPDAVTAAAIARFE